MRKPTALKIAIVVSGREQKDIATEIGVHEATLSRIVNGLHCDDITRAAIARALDRPVAELFPSRVDEPPGEAAA